MSTVTFETLSGRIAILEGFLQEKLEENTTKVVRKTSTKKDEGERKKRPLSGYQLFCNANRQEVQSELTAAAGEGVKLARGAALAELGTRWKALSDEEKKEWVDKRDELSESSEEEKVEVDNTAEQATTSEEEQEQVDVEAEKKKDKKEKKKKKKVDDE